MTLLAHLTDDEFSSIISYSINYADALRKCGVSTNSNNYAPLKNRIKRLKISTSHFVRGYSKDRIPIPLNNVLVENSSYNRGQLKRRLIDNGMIKNKCSICDAPNEWMGKPLVMVLDHINGVNDDNRLENLRLVCPNCNSQLDTHAGRNVAHIHASNKCVDCDKDVLRGSTRCKACDNVSRIGKRRKVERPSKSVLMSMLKSDTYVNVGKFYGVTDNAVRKWVVGYGEDPKSIKISRGEI